MMERLLVLTGGRLVSLQSARPAVRLAGAEHRKMERIRMRKFIIKRIIDVHPDSILASTFIIYALLRCLPSSYVENMAHAAVHGTGCKAL